MKPNYKTFPENVPSSIICHEIPDGIETEIVE